MKSCFFSLILLSFLSDGALAQKLKRADKVIVTNIQKHVGQLEGSVAGTPQQAAGSKQQVAGSRHTATTYIISQFERAGFRPRGGNGSWLQSFEIDEGKAIQPTTYLVIDGDSLHLFRDYTVAAFSANGKVSSVVSAALAEKGMPWFKDFKEVTEGNENPGVEQIRSMIRKKAEHAVLQGASALLIYNTPLSASLFQQGDSSNSLAIPVVLISNAASSKYFSDESAVLDIHLNVSLAKKTRSSNNIIGYADNAADSIIIAAACLGDDTETAALLELARLASAQKSKRSNYLFVVYSGEEEGAAGEKHYSSHPCVDPQKVSLSLRLDHIPIDGQESKGLSMVKAGMDSIHQKQSR